MSGKKLRIKIAENYFVPAQFIFSLHLISIILGFIFISCGPVIQQKKLSSKYDFENKQVVGVYVKPLDNTDLHEPFTNTVQLYFIAKGYYVKDINRLLNNNHETIKSSRSKSIFASLLESDVISDIDLIVIAEVESDTVFAATQKLEEHKNIYGGYNIAQFTTSLEIFDCNSQKRIFHFTSIDQAKIYNFKKNKNYKFTENEWMLAGRQIQTNLNSIPNCGKTHSKTNSKKITAIIWADNSFREIYPFDWQERIRKITEISNNIMRDELGIELEILSINEWEVNFDKSLKQTYQKLDQKSAQDKYSFNIGITYDNSLMTDVTDRSFLGLAKPMTPLIAITCQPTFPGLSYWAPVLEAITLVHEVAHAFGGLHVPDEYSIMHPSSSGLAFKFDEINRHIINTMYQDFMSIDELKRNEKYISNMIHLNDNLYTNRIPIISLLAGYFHNSTIYSLNLDFASDINRNEFNAVIKDSAYALGTMGVIAYNLGYLDTAVKLLTESISLKPDIAELHWYLGLALYKKGDIIESQKFSEIAKPFRNYWLIDNFREL